MKQSGCDAEWGKRNVFCEPFVRSVIGEDSEMWTSYCWIIRTMAQYRHQGHVEPMPELSLACKWACKLYRNHTKVEVTCVMLYATCQHVY